MSQWDTSFSEDIREHAGFILCFMMPLVILPLLFCSYDTTVTVTEASWVTKALKQEFTDMGENTEWCDEIPDDHRVYEVEKSSEYRSYRDREGERVWIRSKKCRYSFRMWKTIEWGHAEGTGPEVAYNVPEVLTLDPEETVGSTRIGEYRVTYKYTVEEEDGDTRECETNDKDFDFAALKVGQKYQGRANLFGPSCFGYQPTRI
jgi:hypothetical protein